MRRARPAVLVPLLLLASVTLLGAPLAAQGRPELRVLLPAAESLATAGPVIRSSGILSRRETRQLLLDGFPSRLHFRVDLWSRGGLFNELRSTVEWDVVVSYDPLGKTFRVHRSLDGRTFFAVGTGLQFEQMLAVVESPFRAGIRPPPRRADRYYYEATLEVETLSITELDEVERWLRGEVQPAIRRQRNPGTALANGVRTLFVRLIGGERDQMQERSRTFRLG